MASGDSLFGMPVKWARRCLAASLVVNFLLIGAAVGVGTKTQPKQWRGTTSYMTAQIIHLTGEDRRAEVRGVLAVPQAVRQERRALRDEKWVGVVAAIGATPFEAQRLAVAFAAGRDQAISLRSQSEAGLARAIAMMTDAERAVLAKRIAAFRENRRKNAR